MAAPGHENGHLPGCKWLSLSEYTYHPAFSFIMWIISQATAFLTPSMLTDVERKTIFNNTIAYDQKINKKKI